MGVINLDQITVTPLNRISVVGGDVLHAIKMSDNGFRNFGEAYFSSVDYGAIKAWKMHTKMTLNLVVPIGNIQFVFISSDYTQRKEFVIGETNYVRLTVPPGIWFGFKGVSISQNLLLNIADIIHDPEEVIKISIDEFKKPFNLK